MAGYDLYTGPDEDERAKVQHHLELFAQVRNRRANFEVMWEESAAVVWPEYRGTFSYSSMRSPGIKQTEFQLDSKGSIALGRFMAVTHMSLTPDLMPWSHYCADNPYLMKDRSVRLYYDEVTRIIWSERYRPEANFVDAIQTGWSSLGAFGNVNTFADELYFTGGEFRPGIRYTNWPVGEVYYLVNHQGRIDGFIRWFRLSARQAAQKWGMEKLAPQIKAALDRKSQEPFEFLQVVCPRADYSPDMVLTNRSMPYMSTYISLTGACIVEEGGYRKFPLAAGRYTVAPGEDNGRGPAQQVLAAFKTKNAEKGVFLKQGHRAGDPAILLPGDDSMFDWKGHPGSANFGLVTEEGRPMAHVMPAGNVAITHEMMQEEDRFIDDAFLQTLYADMFDKQRRTGQLSMAQIVQMLADRATFLAPTLGRQFAYLAALGAREVDILKYQRKFPPLPPVMREATGEYGEGFRFSGPLARALKTPEMLGFMRTVGMANESIKAGADPALMDIFDFEVAYPDIAENNFVPTQYMADDRKIAAKRRARAEAHRQQNYVKSLPGLAAMKKAEAVQSKAAAGMPLGGVLSGTPEGGMPMMPGQDAPGGRAF